MDQFMQQNLGVHPASIANLVVVQRNTDFRGSSSLRRCINSYPKHSAQAGTFSGDLQFPHTNACFLQFPKGCCYTARDLFVVCIRQVLGSPVGSFQHRLAINSTRHRGCVRVGYTGAGRGFGSVQVLAALGHVFGIQLLVQHALCVRAHGFGHLWAFGHISDVRSVAGRGLLVGAVVGLQRGVQLVDLVGVLGSYLRFLCYYRRNFLSLPTDKLLDSFSFGVTQVAVHSMLAYIMPTRQTRS